MVQASDALNSGRIDDWKIQLFISSTQPIKQIKYLVDDPVRARTGAINFIDHNNRVQTLLKRLGRHKPGLRHRAIHCIYQQ